MPPPTAYTETTLKEYQHAVLGALAPVLSWTVAAGSYDQALYEALFAYGTDDVTTITTAANVQRIRALARLAVWRTAVDGLVAFVSFEVDGQKVDRNQLLKGAAAALEQARADAAAYDDSYLVGVENVRYVHDPYEYVPDLDEDGYPDRALTPAP